MSWLKKATSGLWRPVRGVGRLLRGKGDEGMADIGHGIKTVAPVALGATGFGIPAAMAAGAAGGALEKGGETNWSGKSMVGGAAGGALTGAVGHGAGKVGRAAAGRLLTGGGGAPASAAMASGTPSPMAAPRAVPMATGGAGPAGLTTIPSSAGPPMSEVVLKGGPRIGMGGPRIGMVSSVSSSPAANMSKVSMAAGTPPGPPAGSRGVGDLLRGAGGAVKEAGRWIAENPGDAGQLAGGVASLYGAGQDAADRERYWRMVEEDRAGRRSLNATTSPVYARIIRDLMPSAN